jgi:hypothetical protein
MVLLIILATIMATLGVVGFLRGGKSAFATSVFVVGGLLLISMNEKQIVAAINQQQPKLIPANAPGPAMAVVMLFLFALGLLIGGSRALRGRPSISGMLLGLINGYLMTTFLLTALGLGALVQLPLPFGLGTLVQLPLPFGLGDRYGAPAAAAETAAGGDLLKQLTIWRPNRPTNTSWRSSS